MANNFFSFIGESRKFVIADYCEVKRKRAYNRGKKVITFDLAFVMFNTILVLLVDPLVLTSEIILNKSFENTFVYRRIHIFAPSPAFR